MGNKLHTIIGYPKLACNTLSYIHPKISSPPLNRGKFLHLARGSFNERPQLHALLNWVEQSFGGAGRDRTDDLLNAIQALSQLSYSPIEVYI